MLRKMVVLLLGVILLGSGLAGQASARTGFSLSVGSDDFYLSVGNYDYYPYTLPYSNRTPRISFYNVMGDYGSWVSLSSFGQVWRPYVRSNWRPYVNGHWTYTRYGPTWVGYEPWAWAGYHYGNWIWSSRFGWVWIPGYDWHPGRVIWSHGSDTIGWMPAPPQGYDYSRGYLDYRGSNGQFDYYDDDFGYNDDNYYDDGYYDDDYSYGDRYNSGYNNPFYGSGYRNIVVNLWIFIDVNHYRHHNYGDYYLDSDYTRALFDRRLVRISSRPMERQTLERIVRQKINEASVQVREIETDNRKVKIVVPVGEEENIRRNANRVVKNVIAPAFAEKRREFKGLKSENATVVNKVFKQENRQPKIKKQTVDEVLREIDSENAQVERRRKNMIREKTDKVIRNDEAAKSRNKQQDRKEKDVRSGKENGDRQGRQEQFKPNNSRKERDFEFESKQKQKDRDDQFDSKRINKQPEPREFETRQNPKAKDRDFEFESKQNQKNRDDFDKKNGKKQDQRDFEVRRLPKEENPDFQFERSKRETQKSKDADREFDRTYSEPRVESDRNVKQEQESVKRKASSKKDEEQVDDQKNADKEKSKKKKKEDSKKKKQDEPSR